MSPSKHSTIAKTKKRTTTTKKQRNTVTIAAPAPAQYPYYKLMYTPTIARCYTLARTANNKVQPTSRGPCIIDEWRITKELNQLTDYFTEHCRVTCSFLDYPAPLDYWNSHYHTFQQKHWRAGDNSVRNQNKNKQRMSAMIYEQREWMYKSTKICNNFRISVVLAVLRMYHARRWLDISAGWGDRLLGAILYDKLDYYCGVDPNPCVQSGYVDILKFFQFAPALEPTSSSAISYKGRDATYTLIKSGFVEAELPPNITYDLVFSSPPFFNLETYSSESANSITTFSTEHTWLHGFLMPSIKKAATVLDIGGHLILYIAESKNTHYISKMLDLTQKDVKTLKYKGMMYYKDGYYGIPRTFYIWVKYK
jgi:hypothetical protein